MPYRQTKTLTVNGKKENYMTENIINQIGQITKEIVYIKENGTNRGIEQKKYDYDQYGNVVKLTDAKGNVIKTAYDSATNCFPVKIYQAVNIDSYPSGTVHDNWQTDPTVKKKVLIRSWKVFNNDGSL